MHCKSRKLVLAGVAIGMLLVSSLASAKLESGSSAYGLSSPRKVQTPTVPVAILTNGETNKLYLASYNGNSITVLDSQTEKVLAQIKLPSYDEGTDGYRKISMALNPATNKLYAGTELTNLIYVIDGNTDTVVDAIPLDAFERGESIAVNPLTNRVYVASYGNSLYVIDGSTDRIIEEMDIGDHTLGSGHVQWDQPAELTINPNTNMLYATNAGQDLIAVIDGSTNRIVANITIELPFAAVINPYTNKLYISYKSSESIKVVDGTSFEELAEIQDAYAALFRNSGIAADPETNRIYAAKSYPSNEGGIVIIDGKNDTRIEEIKMGFPVFGIAVNPSTGNVYIATDSTAWLYVIDGSPGAFPSSIDVKVGNKTYALRYQMSNGGSINHISANIETLNMSIEITFQSDGVLEITFPRELYDALTFTEHYELIMFVDGREMIDGDKPIEITSSCEQTSIQIPVDAGTKKIELVYSDILMAHSHGYPAKIGLFQTIEEEGQTFGVGLITDAKKCDVSFLKEQKKIHIDIEGRKEATGANQGYFKLTFPHDLLGGNYTILIDGKPVNFEEEIFYSPSYTEVGNQGAFPDDMYRYKVTILEFNYPKDTTSIDVIGTTAIPEFGSVVAPFVMALAIVSVIIVVSAKQFRTKGY